MDTERGIDVLIVVTGWDTIELNSVDVVCELNNNFQHFSLGRLFINNVTTIFMVFDSRLVTVFYIF